MKIILPSALVATMILLSACSSGGSSTNTNTEVVSKTVTVERGPILGAVVLDDDGQQAVQDDNATASYTFETPPVYPVTAYGGYIDVNRNGVIDAGELENTIELQAASGEVLTLLTTILATNDENTTSYFLDDLNLNSALTPTQDLNISALSDVMYEYLIENNLASVDDINLTEIDALKDLVELKIEEYAADDLNASEQEAVLVLKLDIEKFDDADADEVNEKLKGQENAADIIANLPNMSDEQKAHVIDKILKNADKKDKSDKNKNDESTDEDESESDESTDEDESENDESTDEDESENDESTNEDESENDESTDEDKSKDKTNNGQSNKDKSDENENDESTEDESKDKTNNGQSNKDKESPGNSANGLANNPK